MHFDSHNVSGGNGAVARSSTGAGIASNVVAGYVLNRAVALRKTGTLASVQRSARAGIERTRNTYLVGAVDPELLEGGMAHGLLGNQSCKGRELKGFHLEW